MEHENNPFTDDKKRKLGLKSIIYILILSFCAIVCQVFVKNFFIGFSLSFGIFNVSFSLLAAKIKNKITRITKNDQLCRKNAQLRIRY